MAYQTAYLKCHYPVEFYTALLTVFQSNDLKVTNYVQDARQQGIEILKPSLNDSEAAFKILDDRHILYGFGSIKGLQESAITEILQQRPFSDLSDFVSRVTKSAVNKRSVENLVFSGALDTIAGPVRNRMEILQILYGIRGDKEDISGEIASFTKKNMLDREKDLLKVYISGHPLEDVAKPIAWSEIDEGEKVTGHCLLKDIRRITTKKGDPMAFLVLEFVEQDVEAVCFPNLYKSEYTFGKGSPAIPLGPTLESNLVLKVTGRFQTNSDDRTSFILDDIRIPLRINQEKVKEIRSLQQESPLPALPANDRPSLPVYTS